MVYALERDEWDDAPEPTPEDLREYEALEASAMRQDAHLEPVNLGNIVASVAQMTRSAEMLNDELDDLRALTHVLRQKVSDMEAALAAVSAHAVERAPSEWSPFEVSINVDKGAALPLYASYSLALSGVRPRFERPLGEHSVASPFWFQFPLRK